MNLTQLRYVVGIAKSGNMTGAARTLDTSQPAISSAVQKLEEELGTRLFHRDRRGVTLTASGRKVLQLAQNIFEVMDRTRDEIAEAKEDLAGNFTLGCNEAIGTYFLPNFLRSLSETAPGIELSIWAANSSRVTEAVLDRSIDLGIAVNPQAHPDLIVDHLYRDAIQAFVSADEGPVQTLARARQRAVEGPLIVAKGFSAGQGLVNRFEAEGAMPDRTLNCGDLHLVRRLAISGLGVALLPRRVADLVPGELVPLHVALPAYPISIGLLTRLDQHRTQAGMRLKDELIEYGEVLRTADPEITTGDL